jgi:formate hydrogenlyase subunit 6/NADH:ubiquinone oxidoreductase subunit I
MGDGVVLDVRGLQQLLDALARRGRTVVGPTLRDGAVVHAPITSVDELPAGVRDEQEPGRYRVRQVGDERLFAFASAAQSWKPYLFPARQPLMTISPEGDVTPIAEPPVRYAFLGVRACDLAAIAVHDRVLLDRQVVDGPYAARRGSAFIVALACSHPGSTCFCVSMGTGPVPTHGYDLAMTELLDDDGHRFLLRSGSDEGAEVLAELTHVPATETDTDAEAAVAEAARGAMGRTLDTEGLPDVLRAAAEHSRWDDVGSRCLSCTSCTLVCPTCFCVTTDDVTSLDGTTERGNAWDSCFTAGHSYLHGGAVHDGTRERYRQWLTHKFGSWIDQFGTSGCVGCGRCVTWCPAGIDVLEELAALRQPGGAP